MKTCIQHYKKCILAVLLAGCAWLFVAASNDPQPAFKLEGAWVAKTAENGVLSLVTFAPSPSGKTATFRNQMTWPPAVLAENGLSGVTDEIGEEVMTGRNTGTYTARWYGLVGGIPAVVFLDNASFTLNSPTEITIVHQLTAYYADANGQPFGDPVLAGTYHSTSRRIIQ